MGMSPAYEKLLNQRDTMVNGKTTARCGLSPTIESEMK